MDRAFWQGRWDEGRIGFHKEAANTHLMHYGPEVFIATKRVLVPMAGKTHDIDWLLNAGHQVVACEFVPEAVESFFAERGITDYAKEQRSSTDPGGDLEIYSTGALTFIRGDFFKLPALFKAKPELLCDGVYDRAAMIACQPEQRQTYSDCVGKLLKPNSPVLLVALEYDQQEYAGPPFSLSDEQLRAVLGERSIRCLCDGDVLSGHARFAERGMRWLTERCYVFRV